MHVNVRLGPDVIKQFSCSAQLRLKLILLINTEIAQRKLKFKV